MAVAAAPPALGTDVAPGSQPSGSARATADPPTSVGRQVEFEIPDHRGGRTWKRADFAGRAVVVLFTGTECPLANLYGQRLTELAAEYEPRGVRFIGVSSGPQDTPTELSAWMQRIKLPFPLAKDATQTAMDRFGATRTPEAFVLDAAGVIRYQGRIDDRFGVGYQRPKPTREDLKLALDELLAGKPISVARTIAPGCLIGRPVKPSAEGAVTFSKDVAPILERHCVECHRPGEIGPFSMKTYGDLAGWGSMIAEVVQDGRMPPWHASPKHGRFLNEARLTEVEKKTIADWVSAGCPEGSPRGPLAAGNHAEGWRIPKPDLVVEMPKEYRVPASGTVDYQYFMVDPGFTEDKWIRAAECVPGNRAVVHHILMLVLPAAAKRGDGAGRRSTGSAWLAATAPGARPLDLPPGHAKFIPKGSRLVFQMHYTPNGAPQVDRSKVGLVFADPKTVTHVVMTKESKNEWFLIPPGKAKHEVRGTYVAKQDLLVTSLFPHMHLRGSAFRYTAELPGGRREILLDIPRYDFAWQNAYVLEKPFTLPKGAKMVCDAVFDNSEENLSNPNPKSWVRWGDQTWEEMMIGYFDAVVPRAEFDKGR
jgi:peroxiredoxin